MKAVLLGTGSTIGTLGVSAGVNGFTEYLEKCPGWESEYPDLKRVINDCRKDPIGEGEPGLDKIWTRIDYYSKFSKILGSDYGAAASIQLHKAILHAYSFKEKIQELLQSRCNYTLKDILDGLKPGDALISFNWDTLAEQIAKQIGKNLIQAPYPYTGRDIRLIKPHGSISWPRKRDDAFDIYFPGGSPLCEPVPKDIEPLVLGAVPMKSELIREIQEKEYSKLYKLISFQWRETVEVLSKATEIIVAGYSFPREDAYGRFLLREAVLRRPKAMELPIICYYAKNCADYESAFQEVFSSEVNYEYRGEVKPCEKDAESLS